MQLPAPCAPGIAFRVDVNCVDRLVAGDNDIFDAAIRRRGGLPVPAVVAIGSAGRGCRFSRDPRRKAPAAGS